MGNSYQTWNLLRENLGFGSSLFVGSVKALIPHIMVLGFLQLGSHGERGKEPPFFVCAVTLGCLNLVVTVLVSELVIRSSHYKQDVCLSRAGEQLGVPFAVARVYSRSYFVCCKTNC